MKLNIRTLFDNKRSNPVIIKYIVTVDIFRPRMFSLLSAIWEWIFRKEERKLILIGLDNAGKSTTLETLKHHYTGKGMDLERIPPTIGLNSTFVLADVRDNVLSSWKVPSRRCFRNLLGCWRTVESQTTVEQLLQ